MKTKLFILFLFIVLSIIFPSRIFAKENSSATSAVLAIATSESMLDTRVRVLRDFLMQRESPLAPFAQTFVEYADLYSLDWKTVAAISGVESGFGQQIPANSYNAWGWGVYGNNVTRFASWNEGIQTISKGLRTTYMDKWGAKDIFEIGRMYAQSPAWASHVLYYMAKIEDFKRLSPASSLPITL